ncbi:TPA: D-2-hydroxyacid dehydrogenase [Pseudomonas aeruginosa]|uniref:D-2-hydroxyacid dehydrogenase n=1 Tax=Pseudomonas TaxID=286 RepID=UPI000CD3F59B|nr:MULTISPECIES: D-2-hydroxyacid dehydrogenase [Pseudomonas]MBH9518247.1 D-2-hydroxyacid dehydrogenase [Pseudomonas aeruginosa]MBI8577275.1 D-2-hydroxyacid dehydrogenase [Pseudomonas aeruginosa]MBI8804350.1 D-2-hydroxyacid dehydrogenase [Pseudomonas aeruginosa]MCU9210311.1 D-2-hydroxyacid dehydrogenase [Pseudomonas aeruginosa]MDA3374390.1 D-2-hydroxyacid dehydrogenase [Pseudomonas aeruginosa]
MKHRVVFLDDEGIGPGVITPELPFDHDWVSYPYTQPEQLVERLKGATVALTCSVPLREEHLAQLPDLQMISLALTGTDIVDLDYCRAHGIKVTNVPGYATNTVAEHSIGMMFELFRRVSSYHRLMQQVHSGAREAKNIYFDFPIRDLRSRVLGIVGNGPIAKRVAELGRAIGMSVIFHDRGGRYSGPNFVSLDVMLQRSDVLMINCPLTEETRDLIDAPQLAQMKPDAVIVNTGRGGVINEAALIEAMEQGRLGGAALDVIEHEPPQADNPIFRLINHPNFILNPHVAWSSQDAMQGLIDQALGNIAQFVNSTPTEALRAGAAR